MIISTPHHCVFFAMGWLLSPIQNKEESDENKRLSRGSPTSESRTKVTKCSALICLPAWQGKMTMTKMWSGGVEYNLTGQGFDPTKGAIFRAGAVMPPGVNSNRELGVRSTLLSALLCSDTQLFCAEEAPGSPVGSEQ